MKKPKEIKQWSHSVGMVVLNDGTTLYCPQTLNLIRHIIMCYIDSIYDPKVIELTEEDKEIVDVGGYIGMFGIYAAKKTGGRVTIYEPLPHMAEFCALNVKANKLSERVQVSTIAVAGKTEERTMRYWMQNPEMGYFSKTDGFYNLNAQIQVHTASLDELGYKKIDFLKLNCEGAEGDIVPAMSEELLRNTKKIAMQMHEKLSPVSGKELKKILELAGFQIKDATQGADVGWIYAWKK